MQKSFIKKPISVLLSILMVLSVFSVTAFAGSPSGNIGGDLHTETDVTVGGATTYNTPNEEILAADLKVGDILASPGAGEEYAVDGNDEYYFVLRGGGYLLRSSNGVDTLQTEDLAYPVIWGDYTVLGDSGDSVPWVDFGYAPADKDGNTTDKWYVIAIEDNAITISGYMPESGDSSDPAVQNVIALIDAIGTVANNNDSKQKVTNARTAYDALTDEQKALVENYETLIAAEVRYAELKAEAETPDEPAEATPEHGEHCFCYKYSENSTFGKLSHFICSILSIFYNVFEVFGIA